jgi:hypothetical protein
MSCGNDASRVIRSPAQPLLNQRERSQVAGCSGCSGKSRTDRSSSSFSGTLAGPADRLRYFRRDMCSFPGERDEWGFPDLLQQYIR